MYTKLGMPTKCFDCVSGLGEVWLIDNKICVIPSVIRSENSNLFGVDPCPVEGNGVMKDFFHASTAWKI